MQTQAPSLNPVITRLFSRRGIAPQDIPNFLSWNLKDIPDLTQMIDLQKASLRLIEAINKGEKIGVYGDYDVDGTTSCALLWHFFKMLNYEVQLYQPSRFVEGYGVHPSSIDEAVNDGVSVLITVDCGITNTQTADYAQGKLDLIITDHHRDAAPELPKAYAVVNPCRRDEPSESPLRALAGVGVAFALALQIKNDLAKAGRELPSIYPLLQFVAIGTISDLARMTPLNLRLTRHGLKQIPKTEYPGIRAFFAPEELNVEMMSSEKISFHVGPHINSKGRLDHPERALKQLISTSDKEAREHFMHLELANRDRKIIQKEVFDEAKEMVIKNLSRGEHLISIVHRPHWHEGVIGIVASKLVETFGVPAIVFSNAEENGIIKASARAAGELNIFELLQNCSDLFIKFGGHKAAAGLSMPYENLGAFIERMNEQLRQIPEPLRVQTDSFDIDIDLEEISPGLVKDLERLEPFGPGNERPIFRMKNAKIQSFRIMKDLHVRWMFSSEKAKLNLQGVSFNYIGKWNEPSPEELFQYQNDNGLIVQFSLGVNRFNGNESIQLMVDKLKVGQI
ncbi:MAG TPA: single-stranded-DNA-specific exonuclease RecJ [Bacteriovoracaceae bacterium]|nr:single-stranded-DNA-specific exonuclease RecJ [Bacteriovoracaceae bacterium]